MSTQKELQETLKALKIVVSKRSALPVLHYVHIGPQTMHTTDLSAGVLIVGDTGLESGICAPHDLLSRIVKAMDKGAVTFKNAPDNMLTVSQGVTESNIIGMPEEEYPMPPPLFGFSQWADFTLAELRDAIGRLAGCMSYEPSRLNINGVCFEPGREAFNIAATDGRRLRVETVSAISHVGNKQGCDGRMIVPRDTVTALLKLLPAKGGDDTTVTMFFNDTGVCFAWASIVLMSNIVDGIFPSVYNVVPSQMGTWVTACRKELIGAITKCRTLTTDRFNMVKFDINGVLEVSINSPELGNMQSLVECCKAGPDCIIGINPDYAIDAASNGISDLVEIGIKDAQSASVWRDPELFTALEIVMPVRL